MLSIVFVLCSSPPTNRYLRLGEEPKRAWRSVETMGGTCVKDEYTLFCPLALQETATGRVCCSNGFSNLETLGKHIRQHCTTKRVVLPNSARATSLAGHQQLFDDCRKEGFLGASPNSSMTRAGVCSLCSTSQYQLFEAESITASQVKALPAEDPAVW